VAGGVPAGLTPWQTLLKEAAEEAAIPAKLAGQARLAGHIACAMDRPEGLRRDLLFNYDLDLPESFEPRPMDGEVDGFELWPLRRALEAVRDTDQFKFNVNLVLIDLFLHRGLIEAGLARRLRAGNRRGLSLSPSSPRAIKCVGARPGAADGALQCVTRDEDELFADRAENDPQGFSFG
jgi:hypothetical protein